MNWCRCARCGHKLFLYDETKAKKENNLAINIKCSSCKRILSVIVLDGRVVTKSFGEVKKIAKVGREVDNKAVAAVDNGGIVGGKE